MNLIDWNNDAVHCVSVHQFMTAGYNGLQYFLSWWSQCDKPTGFHQLKAGVTARESIDEQEVNKDLILCMIGGVLDT